jgi:hypothetical protein
VSVSPRPSLKMLVNDLSEKGASSGSVGVLEMSVKTRICRVKLEIKIKRITKKPLSCFNTLMNIVTIKPTDWIRRMNMRSLIVIAMIIKRAENLRLKFLIEKNRTNCL